jgi:hypothetical protein
MHVSADTDIIINMASAATDEAVMRDDTIVLYGKTLVGHHWTHTAWSKEQSPYVLSFRQLFEPFDTLLADDISSFGILNMINTFHIPILISP